MSAFEPRNSKDLVKRHHRYHLSSSISSSISLIRKWSPCMRGNWKSNNLESLSMSMNTYQMPVGGMLTQKSYYISLYRLAKFSLDVMNGLLLHSDDYRQRSWQGLPSLTATDNAIGVCMPYWSYLVGYCVTRFAFRQSLSCVSTQAIVLNISRISGLTPLCARHNEYLSIGWRHDSSTECSRAAAKDSCYSFLQR